MKRKVRVNGEMHSEEFVLGQIWESVKNIERRFDELDNHGCGYANTLSANIRSNELRITQHETQHKTAYAVIGIFASIAGWIASKFT